MTEAATPCHPRILTTHGLVAQTLGHAFRLTRRCAGHVSLRLLQLALDKADAAKYMPKVSDQPMLQGRALLELPQGGAVRVGM